MKNFHLFPKRFGALPYVFLIYLVMPIIYAANETGLKAVIGYLLVLLFFVSYRQLYWMPPVKVYTLWLVIQIGLVVILAIWYDSYNLLLGFFPANFIGWYEKEKHFRYALVLFAIVLFATAILKVQSGFNILFFIPFLVIMIASPFGIRSMSSKMELEMQLEEANEQLKMMIKREERVRIARDLHDTLGHTLSLITLQSQLVQRLADKNPDRVKVEAKEIEMTSRSALQQVRELVSDMRAITIKEEIAHMQQIIEAADITFRFEGEEDVPELSLLQQNIVGLCIREAGTNIVRHSNAENCHILLEKGKGYFTVQVEDDGIGITNCEMKGNGLNGMKERLALIEGEFLISSEQGTTLVMKIPIVMKQEKEEIAI